MLVLVVIVIVVVPIVVIVIVVVIAIVIVIVLKNSVKTTLRLACGDVPGQHQKRDKVEPLLPVRWRCVLLLA